MRRNNSAEFETEFNLGNTFETNLNTTLNFESGFQENSLSSFETEFNSGEVFNADLTNVLTFESGLQEITAVYKSDHNILKNRDLDNQHPISAISGLQAALNAKQDLLLIGENSGIVIENNYIRLDDLILDCGTSTTVI